MTDLERRLRAARPSAARRGDPLGPRAESELSLLLSGAARPADATIPLPLNLEAARPEERVAPADRGAAPRRAVRWRPIAFGLAVAAVASAMIVGGGLGTVPRTQATVPQPLSTAVMERNSADTLRQLAAVRRDGAAVPAPVVSQSWSLAVREEEDGDLTASIVPEVREIDPLPGGGYRMTVRAGTAFEPVPGSAVVPQAAVLPGTDLWSGVVPAEEAPFRSSPPEQGRAMGEYLRTEGGLGARPSTPDLVRAIIDLRSHRVLTGPQEAAILDLLASRSDFSLAGRTIDRDGRDGLIFLAKPEKTFDTQMSLIVSASGGGLISSETVYDGEARTDIPRGSVINYVLWKE